MAFSFLVNNLRGILVTCMHGFALGHGGSMKYMSPGKGGEGTTWWEYLDNHEQRAEKRRIASTKSVFNREVKLVGRS